MRFARAGASSFTNKPYPEDADSWEDMIAPIRAQLDANMEEALQSSQDETTPKSSKKENNKRKHLSGDTGKQSSEDANTAKSPKKENSKRKHSLSGDTDKSKLLKISGTNETSFVELSPPDLLDKTDDSKPSKSKNKVKSKESKNTSKGLLKQCSPVKNSLPSSVQERTKSKHIRTSSMGFDVCNFVSGVKKLKSCDGSSADSPVRESHDGRQKNHKKVPKIKPKDKSGKSDSSSESNSSEDSDAPVESTSSNQNQLQSALQARNKNEYGDDKTKSKTNNKTKSKTNNKTKSKTNNKTKSKTNGVAGGRVSAERNTVRFGRHIISKEAFAEITELKRKWKEEGRPDDVIEEAVKLRARRDEKIRKHQKKKMANATCYACQQTGHVIADCPQVGADGASSSSGMAGICYTCGSTEHNSKQCRRQSKREKRQVFSLATCFRCNKSGHIARQCEENACFTCGQHGHIQRHCPKAGTGVKNAMGKDE